MLIRWLKFNAVGAAGALVQLLVVALLTGLEVHYLLATAIAIECALLHNYAWHVRWTWKDRPDRRGSLVRFHLANGIVSMLSNLFWVRVFAGWLGVGPVVANAIAILLTSIANYLLGDRWVFASRQR